MRHKLCKPITLQMRKKSTYREGIERRGEECPEHSQSRSTIFRNQFEPGSVYPKFRLPEAVTIVPKQRPVHWSACVKSSLKSFTSSIPTLNLTKLSVRPRSLR